MTLKVAGRTLRDEDYETERKEMEPLEDKRPFGKVKITRMRSLGWDDFDRIYRIAAESVFALREKAAGQGLIPRPSSDHGT